MNYRIQLPEDLTRLLVEKQESNILPEKDEGLNECDRIIWFGKGLKQTPYGRGEFRLSDHRPVYAIFTYLSIMNTRRGNIANFGAAIFFARWMFSSLGLL
ncbi:hypothetical protein L484_004294 [Morus notabilis]|uniref:Uncharacterized protein n=1 Tax=Morus notabilis TaxID=981085 RepID=W9S0N6_9ROSA|nr:hypothetical protein L484_004294 [Morus notabilis]